MYVNIEYAIMNIYLTVHDMIASYIATYTFVDI